MKSLEQYWNESYQQLDAKPTYDNWLDKYWDEYLAKYSKTDLIIDLGCGVGNNTQYFRDRELSPMACDISEEAIQRLLTFMPDILTRCLDMTKELPFDQESVQVLIADLSIHYFDEKTTHELIRDLHRVLKKDGILLCRVNSTNEINNVGETSPSDERYVLESEGIYRRFFDRGEIERFFKPTEWSYVYVEQYEMDRYKNPKMLWEIALLPR